MGSIIEWPVPELTLINATDAFLLLSLLCLDKD